MKLAHVLLLLFAPSLAYAGDTCDVTSVDLYNDIQQNSGYGGDHTHDIKPCAEVEVMNTSGGDRLTVYITAHFRDGNYKRKEFTGGYVERGRTRTHKICWNKDYKIQTFTCEF